MTPDASTVILLVEDDDRLRQLVMQRLEGKECWVVCARNGEEAWDLFSAHRPLMSLLLTEVMLPDIDGLVVAGRSPVDRVSRGHESSTRNSVPVQTWTTPTCATPRGSRATDGSNLV